MVTCLNTTSLGCGQIDKVIVEVESKKGQCKFSIIGLGDSAIRESGDRVLSAIRNTGLQTPPNVLVNLSPAHIKKEGSYFDLPIALGLILKQIQSKRDLTDAYFIGELSLEGEVRSVNGIEGLVIGAIEHGAKTIYLPPIELPSSSQFNSVELISVKSLSQLVKILEGQIDPSFINTSNGPEILYKLRIDDIKGQYQAKRAIEIAAAGGHNTLFVGPPGCGKSMLAKRLAYLLPPLTDAELIESLRIHALAGATPRSVLSRIRPYRAPHHSCTSASMLGSVSGTYVKPGDYVIAHNGVLFLDELPEFNRNVLEALRSPLEDGQVNVSRARAKANFAAKPLLIGAMNPCPCGHHGDKQKCSCPAQSIQRYQNRISGPIWERFDIFCHFEPISYEDLKAIPNSNEHDKMQLRIAEARQFQLERQGCLNRWANSQNKFEQYLQLDQESDNLLSMVCNKRGLSARTIKKILLVARTVSDLEGAKDIRKDHLTEVLKFCLPPRIS